MKKLFVFDWNGTLLDDSEPTLVGFNASMEFYGQKGVTLDHYRETMDFPLIHVYTRNGVHPDAYLQNYDEATQVFFRAYKPLARLSTLKDGTVELLDFLTDQGYDLMILSNQNDADLREQIAERHITHYFRVISGNQDNSIIHHNKTNKLERLKSVLGAHEYDLGQSWIIGDSMEEPELARDFGMNCFSVTWGLFSQARLEKGPAQYVIDDLAQVQEILQKSPAKKAL